MKLSMITVPATCGCHGRGAFRVDPEKHKHAAPPSQVTCDLCLLAKNIAACEAAMPELLAERLRRWANG